MDAGIQFFNLKQVHMGIYLWICYYSQLFYDGHQNLAVNLATAVKAHPACSPSDRLMKIVQLGIREEEGTGSQIWPWTWLPLVSRNPCPSYLRFFDTIVLADFNDLQRAQQNTALPGHGLDLEFETDVKSISPDASQYETLYVTSHKGPCRAGVFHPRG